MELLKKSSFFDFQAEILVCPQGACSQAIINAGGPLMKQCLVTPDTGDVTVTPGFGLACSHVLHTNCCHWYEGKGEKVSIN